MTTTIRIFKLLTLSMVCLLSLAARTEASEFVTLPGDVLHITVWKEEGLDREITVLPDGTITFPLVGTITVQDMTPQAIQDTIRTQLENTIPDASVSVSVKAPLGHKASILGQVQKPGEVILSSRTYVMQALSQAGGLTAYADKSDIVVIRLQKDGKKQIIPFPYNDIARGRKLDKDVELQSGDVVLVPTDGLF